MSEFLDKGWFPYRDGQCTVMQHPDVYEPVKTLFTEIRPSTVLEIGSAQGGFTVMVRDILDSIGLQTTKMVTWDIYDHGVTTYTRLELQDRIDGRVENIFSHERGNLIPEIEEEVIQLIQGEGTTVIFCDGGDKLNELQTLSKFLKSGDIIMTHDYHSDKEKYISMSKEELVNSNIWPFCETWDSGIDVPDDVLPYKKEELERVAWLCMRRQ